MDFVGFEVEDPDFFGLDEGEVDGALDDYGSVVGGGVVCDVEAEFLEFLAGELGGEFEFAVQAAGVLVADFSSCFGCPEFDDSVELDCFRVAGLDAVLGEEGLDGGAGVFDVGCLVWGEELEDAMPGLAAGLGGFLLGVFGFWFLGFEFGGQGFWGGFVVVVELALLFEDAGGGFGSLGCGGEEGVLPVESLEEGLGFGVGWFGRRRGVVGGGLGRFGFVFGKVGVDLPMDSVFGALREVGVGGEAGLSDEPGAEPVEEGVGALGGVFLDAAFGPGFEEGLFGCGAGEEEAFAGAGEGDVKKAGFFGDEFFSLFFFAKPVGKGGIGLGGAGELESPA